uniref:Integrase catalytic domain-containing protein n=1 Tax=Tanacetum cinerariifolium TaxID=118510 RepID=A0A6L2KX30_TANCI|nr:hypothetical protein [Tanacetum cinerariifolium]
MSGRGFFEKQKLTGPNFIDWYRQLRIVLSIEDKLSYLEQPIPLAPIVPAGQHEEGQSVSSYVLKMKGYIDNLEHLGNPVTLGLGTINELHAMLKLHEQTLPKNNALALHAIRAGKVQKVNKHKKSQTQMAARGQNHRKEKNKQAYAPKPKISPSPKREDPAKYSICHEYGETGNWKRICPQYLAELLKKKKNAASGAGGSGIFVIELNTILNRSWIYDTSCGTHICNTTQGLRASRKLKPGALSLYVGNGQREVVEAIGTFHLELPSGLVIVLNNFHYAPSITRGVISVSRLFDGGFVNRFDDNNVISVSKNNLVYFKAIPRDGKCVSCMSGKMARKPYSHQVERAKDLLGLIHTDVCGPFKIVSRQGASYFVTFTDDFSRYGYVYLLKHKHEVFETFKLFQKEVENQLGKIIKSLRSDRGGYPKETIEYSFYSPSENKVFVAQNAEFFESKPLDLKASGSVEDLKLIQEEDTNPSVDTSLDHEEDDQEIDEPQSDINHIRKSSRTRCAPDRMCLYIDAEEHELGDLGEPANYKAALLDPESKKWLDVMNVEMQSVKDNDPPQEKSMAELLLEAKLPQALQTLCEKINKYVQEKQEENNIVEEQEAKVSSQYWNPPIYYDDDDDDEEYSIQVSEFYKNSPIAIIPVLLTVEPEDSLSMGDEHLSTILEKESDKEFAGELAPINPIPPRIVETNFDPEEEIRLIEKLLNNDSPHSPEELNSEILDAIIESFSPSPIPVEDNGSLMEEIDIFLAPND